MIAERKLNLPDNSIKSLKTSTKNRATTPLSNRRSKSISDDVSKDKSLKIQNQPTMKVIQNLRDEQSKTDSQCYAQGIQGRSTFQNFDLDGVVVNIDEDPNPFSPEKNEDRVGIVKYNAGEVRDNNSSKNSSIDLNTVTLMKNQNLTLQKSERANNTSESIMFFFINRFSGNCQGEILLNMLVKRIEFSGDVKVIAYFYEINDNEGMSTLISECQGRTFVKVIICSGDGSVYPFIEKLQKTGIDMNKIIFGVVPIGTTNDISRQFGFGDHVKLSSDMNDLRHLVKKLSESPSTTVDLWEVKLTFDLEGGIVPCGDTKEPKHDSKNKNVTIFRRGFVGYFSLGYDGRIGFNASKKRSKFRCMNSLVLYWEKMKKCFFRKSINVKGFIEGFYAFSADIDYDQNEDIEENASGITTQENARKKIAIFKTNGKINKSSQNNRDSLKTNSSDEENNHSLNVLKYHQVVLKGEPIGFVCQNIKYFFNGEQTSWNDCVNGYGIETFDPTIDRKDKAAYELKKEKDKKFFDGAFKQSCQSVCDQKLEFYTYSSISDMQGKKKKKIYHGSGPFLLKFKATPIYNACDKFNRVYLNIDGEYYYIMKPNEMRVRLNKTINNGKVKFLQNV